MGFSFNPDAIHKTDGAQFSHAGRAECAPGRIPLARAAKPEGPTGAGLARHGAHSRPHAGHDPPYKLNEQVRPAGRLSCAQRVRTFVASGCQARLRPDTSSPEDCLCLPKDRASGPGGWGTDAGTYFRYVRIPSTQPTTHGGRAVKSSHPLSPCCCPARIHAAAAHRSAH